MLVGAFNQEKFLVPHDFENFAGGSLAALLKTMAYSFTIFKVFSSSRLESVWVVFNIGDSQQSSFKVG